MLLKRRLTPKPVTRDFGFRGIVRSAEHAEGTASNRRPFSRVQWPFAAGEGRLNVPFGEVALELSP
jgi:hypothetical protein